MGLDFQSSLPTTAAVIVNIWNTKRLTGPLSHHEQASRASLFLYNVGDIYPVTKQKN